MVSKRTALEPQEVTAGTAVGRVRPYPSQQVRCARPHVTSPEPISCGNRRRSHFEWPWLCERTGSRSTSASIPRKSPQAFASGSTGTSSMRLTKLVEEGRAGDSEKSHGARRALQGLAREYRVLGISPTGHHARQRHAPPPRIVADAELDEPDPDDQRQLTRHGLKRNGPWSTAY